MRDYREAITQMAEMRILDVWYLRLDGELIRAESAALNKKAARQIDRDLSSAGRKDSIRALSRLSRVVDGKPRFVSAPLLLVRGDELLSGEALQRSPAAIASALDGYRSSLSQERQVLYDFYRYQDMARKVVGVGRFVGRSQYANAGQRVVVGQRLMQATGDILLGWYRVVGFDGNEHDFHMRRLWDGKGSFTVDKLDFAEAYAEQNQRDYEALRAAADSGRVSAEMGI